jgi:hypothetical protein
MDVWKGVCGSGALVVSLLLMAQPAGAQADRAGRPYRALFGGDASNQRSRHQLDLTLSLNGGLDNGPGAPSTSATDPLEAAATNSLSEFYAASAALAYTLHGGATEAGASATTSLPYYSTLPEIKELAYGTAAHLNYVSGATTVGVSGTYSYSPFFNSLLDPSSGSVMPGGDFGAVANPNNAAAASAVLTQRMGRASSLTAGYTLNGILFEQGDQKNISQSARLSADRRLSRRTTITGGYGYRTSDYTYRGVSNPTTSHDFDLGFGYTRGSSRTRTFSMSASAGASLIDYQDLKEQGWRASIVATQTVSDAWSVGGSYSRALQLDGAVLEPVWGDYVTANANGRIGRRASLAFGAGYSHGEQVRGSASAYHSYYGQAGVQVALATSLSITAGYLFNRYDYPPGFNLPAGMPHHLDRQRVQVGANIWLPLARSGRARRTGAAATK